MNDLDARLMAALQADAPPARDAIFRVEVLARLERARFRRRVAVTVVVAFAVAVAVAVNAPAIGAWVARDVWGLGLIALGVPAALLAVPGVLGATPGVRTIARTLSRWLYP